jgi:sigma-B regulation protein RsbU (phosphoserine phosphatase)
MKKYLIIIGILLLSSYNIFGIDQKNTEGSEDRNKPTKEERINTLRQEIDHSITENHVILLSSIALILLTIAIIIGLYNRNKYIKKTNQLIDNKNKELNKLVTKLSESNAEKDYLLMIINDDISIAYSYVLSLMSPPIRNGKVRVAWKYVPSSDLGGDALGYHWLDDENFAFYIIDVSGHGICSAMHAVSVLNILSNQSLQEADFTKPEEVISSLNKIFQMNRYNELYFTMVYGVFNKNTRVLKYSSAGHPPPIMISGKEIRPLDSGNFIVGGVKDMIYNFSSVNIPHNSSIYLYSDGIYEVPISEDEMLTTNDFLKFLKGKKKDDDKEIEEWYSYVSSLNSSKSLLDDFTMLKITFD